ATGVEASPLAKKLGVELDKAGRVIVEKDLSIPGHKNIFVIGDMAAFYTSDGKQVPAVAPAAMQMAGTAVENILRDLLNKPRKEFIYIDKGSMATIGRNKAIVEIGKIKLSGFIAWLAWLLVHLISLIGFRNRLRVLSDWIWAYFTRERSAILITGDAEELQKLNLQK
ncbi:MAG: NAD(P)/FAD-dependent oxidoreductase, partial [Acidobacteria bacterium]